MPHLDIRAANLGSALIIAPIFMFMIGAPAAASANEGLTYYEMSAGYTTGDFGTTNRSDLYRISAVFGYITPRYDLSVTVPYLILPENGGGVKKTQNGPGDIIMRGGLELLPEGLGGFSLGGSLAAKLPTADQEKGLGTGEADYGAFISARQRLYKTRLFIQLGYIALGRTSSEANKGVYLYGAGVWQIIFSGEIYVSFVGRKRAIAEVEDPQEIHAGFLYPLSANHAIKGGVFTGLNNGGPDYGLTMGVVNWF